MKIKVFYYYLLCIYCISGCPLVFAEKSMYKNSINGITSFSDRQTAESEIIILDNKRNLISTEPTENRPNFDSRTSSNINTVYNVKILNIINEQTFRNIQNLEIKVSVAPPLSSDLGQKLKLLLNAKTVQPVNVGGNTFELSNIVRGAHKLKAEVVDFKGRLLGESENLTIYVHKHSIIQ